MPISEYRIFGSNTSYILSIFSLFVAIWCFYLGVKLIFLKKGGKEIIQPLIIRFSILSLSCYLLSNLLFVAFHSIPPYDKKNIPICQIEIILTLFFAFSGKLFAQLLEIQRLRFAFRDSSVRASRSLVYGMYGLIICTFFGIIVVSFFILLSNNYRKFNSRENEIPNFCNDILGNTYKYSDIKDVQVKGAEYFQGAILVYFLLDIIIRVLVCSMINKRLREIISLGGKTAGGSQLAPKQARQLVNVSKKLYTLTVNVCLSSIIVFYGIVGANTVMLGVDYVANVLCLILNFAKYNNYYTSICVICLRCCDKQMYFDPKEALRQKKIQKMSQII